MKLQYVVPLEILRITGSASQIMDTKISIKTSLEVVKSRKTLTKNDHRSLWIWYVSKDLDSRIPKLVSNIKMGKRSFVFSEFENSKTRVWIWQRRCVRGCMYHCVYGWEIRKEKHKSCTYTQRRMRRKLVKDQFALYGTYCISWGSQLLKLRRWPPYIHCMRRNFVRLRKSKSHYTDAYSGWW